jgi:amino acid transporter
MLSKLEKIMEKNEFKKMMKKENKAFKNYYVYEMILILLLAIIVIPNIILTINNMIPFNITIINALLIIIVALPFIVLDIKNDLDIKNMHQYYLKEKKIPEYKVKTKNLNVCLIISIAVLIIWAIITIPNITKTENLSEIENTLVITTNNGNNIETQYEMFDGFKIKIPSEFKIMSDEILNVKYPNGNAPSLVYTNDKTTINVVLVMNDVTMKNNQIEEYVKTMESTYKNYSKDVKLKFWERNNHKIGEMEFTTEGSDTEIYNHIITFSVNDKLRLVNFNCTKEQMNEWQKVSKFIMDSIMFE